MERSESARVADSTRAAWISTWASVLVFASIVVVLWRVEGLRTDAGDPMRWTETIDGRTVQIEVRSRPGETLDQHYLRLKERWLTATRRD